MLSVAPVLGCLRSGGRSSDTGHPGHQRLGPSGGVGYRASRWFFESDAANGTTETN
jgi:hypothetical protein